MIDFRGAWKKMFADAGVEIPKLDDMPRSAVRNAIRRGVDRDTVKKDERPSHGWRVLPLKYPGGGRSAGRGPDPSDRN